MTETSKSVSFIVNGQPVAEIGDDGKLKPTHALPTRTDQIEIRLEFGRQAWIAQNFFTDVTG